MQTFISGFTQKRSKDEKISENGRNGKGRQC